MPGASREGSRKDITSLIIKLLVIWFWNIERSQYSFRLLGTICRKTNKLLASLQKCSQLHKPPHITSTKEPVKRYPNGSRKTGVWMGSVSRPVWLCTPRLWPARCSSSPWLFQARILSGLQLPSGFSPNWFSSGLLESCVSSCRRF